MKQLTIFSTLLLSALNLTACSAKYETYTKPTADFPMIGKTIQLKPGVLIMDMSELHSYIYTSNFGPRGKKILSITGLNVGYAYDYDVMSKNRYDSIMYSVELESKDVIENTRRNLVYKPQGMTCKIKKVYAMQPFAYEGLINDTFVEFFGEAKCDGIDSDIIVYNINDHNE